MDVCAVGSSRRGVRVVGSTGVGSRDGLPRTPLILGALLVVTGAACKLSPLTHCTDPGGCKLPLVCHQKTNLCVWPEDAGADAGDGTVDAGGNTGDAGGNTGDAGGNTGDAGGNTGDAGGNTGDAGGNTGDAGGNTGDAGGNTGDAGESTSDAGESTSDAGTADGGVAPTALTYASPTAIYTKSLAITQNSPLIQGGVVESYDVSPALPSGLAIDVSTGVISGTPIAVTAQAVYTVTATNRAGSTSFRLSITVVDSAPSDLQYSSNPVVYTKGTAITPNVPRSTGGAIASYTVTPSLPEGLSLDRTTGTISGTPTALTAQASYTVTGVADSGRTSATLTITTIDLPPSNLRYTASAVSCRTGYPLSLGAPTSSGGAVVSYSVAPALPAGLSINPTTGVISGIPTLALTGDRTTSHLVTATNTGGGTIATLSVTLSPRLGTNGTVHTVAMGADETVYLGGAFTEVGPVTGGGVPLDASTGMVGTLPAVAGSVLAVVTDGSGGWFVGGKFSGVGGTPKSNLTHILGDGTVDSAWPSANDTVRALAVSDGVVYVGGDFTSVSKLVRNHLAAITVSGDVTSWDPNANGSVLALAVSGGIVYAGGSFYELGPNPSSSFAMVRKNLAAISVSGEVTPWAPNAAGTVCAIAVANNTIYVGGHFFTLRPNSTPGSVLSRSSLAAINLAGEVTSWNPSPDNPVFALAVQDDTIYVGGAFTTIGGSSRNRLAAIRASGELTSWDPKANGNIQTLAVYGGKVYAGGNFTKLGTTDQRQLAAIDAWGGSYSWRPRVAPTPRLAPVEKGIYALSIANGTVYAGGYITTSDGAFRNNLAALSPSGALTAWNPNANDLVRALAVNEGIVYAGGAFTSIGSTSRMYLAALYPSGAVVTSWNPAPNSWVLALASHGNTLYAGGEFSQMGNAPRNRLAAIESGVLTSWNPDANDSVNTLAIGGSAVYAGGRFTQLGGAARNRLAAIDFQGVVADSWNPNASGEVSALVTSGSTVYAGGDFGSLGGDPRSGLAAIESSGLVTSWNPRTNGELGSVNALAARGSTLFAGGTFTSFGGNLRNRIAAIEPSGLATSWDPNISNDAFGTNVRCIVASESAVYAGGDFITMGSQPVAFFARIPE